MASEAFQLLDNVTKLPADIVNGSIYTSPDQDNATGTTYPSVRLIADYIDLQSTDGTAIITTVLEGKSFGGTDYFPLAYQFCGFGTVGFQQRRELVIQPDLFWPDAGVDNIIFLSGVGTIAQVSNTPAVLSPTWRIQIHINDPNSTFVSLKLSLYGERFSV